jgi:hypothetical protein
MVFHHPKSKQAIRINSPKPQKFKKILYLPITTLLHYQAKRFWTRRMKTVTHNNEHHLNIIMLSTFICDPESSASLMKKGWILQRLDKCCFRVPYLSSMFKRSPYFVGIDPSSFITEKVQIKSIGYSRLI